MCTCFLYHFAGYTCILIAWESTQSHNFYQTVVDPGTQMWYTMLTLTLTNRCVWIQFTNKGSFYIALLDILLADLSLNAIAFAQMAVQIPFMSHCSFYKTSTFDVLLDHFTINAWLGTCNFHLYCHF